MNQYYFLKKYSPINVMTIAPTGAVINIANTLIANTSDAYDTN
jgi:hypothetical protein